MASLTTNYKLHTWLNTDRVILSDLNTNFNTIDSQMKTNADGISSLNSAVSGLSTTSGTHSTDIAALKSKDTTFDTQLKEFNSKLTAMQTKIDQLSKIANTGLKVWEWYANGLNGATLDCNYPNSGSKSNSGVRTWVGGWLWSDIGITKDQFEFGIIGAYCLGGHYTSNSNYGDMGGFTIGFIYKRTYSVSYSSSRGSTFRDDGNLVLACACEGQSTNPNFYGTVYSHSSRYLEQSPSTGISTGKSGEGIWITWTEDGDTVSDSSQFRNPMVLYVFYH